MGLHIRSKFFKISRQCGSAYKLSRYHQGSEGLRSLFFLSLLVFFFFLSSFKLFKIKRIGLKHKEKGEVVMRVAGLSLCSAGICIS